MTLTLGPILHSAGIDPKDVLVIRHAYVREHEDTGTQGIHASSTDEEILRYTNEQSMNPKSFPSARRQSGWSASVRAVSERASGRCSRTVVNF
jgi:hypothetical protein